MQYVSVRDELRKTVSEYLENVKPSEILITGHSLGGGLANLCAIDMIFNKIKPNENTHIKVVTFGAPKVGNYDFRKLMDDNVDCLRMVHSTDIIKYFKAL